MRRYTLSRLRPVRRGTKLYLSFISARELRLGDELCIVSKTRDRKNWVKAQLCSRTDVRLPAKMRALRV